MQPLHSTRSIAFWSESTQKLRRSPEKNSINECLDICMRILPFLMYLKRNNYSVGLSQTINETLHLVK